MDISNQEMDAEPVKTYWSIDLEWYQPNSRSFTALAQRYLCPKCAKQLDTKGKNMSANTLLSNIKDCCSHVPGFIADQQPIMESTFRLFLSNGNQPLDLEELSSQLSEWRGGDYRTSIEILSRLFKNDRYYGLREIKDSSTQPNT